MILLSEGARRAVCGRGWPAGRTTVIRNGIAIPGAPRRGWLRQELGISPDAVILTCVGSLITRKGHDVLLPAVSRHLGGGPERHLVIVGDGPEEAALRVLAGSLGVARFVHFLGLRNDVPDLLADSDLFVLASRAEGLTLAVVEAMAAGLPVVVTDVGGHREVVRPGTGWVVPSENAAAFGAALGEALADPPATRAAGAAARRTVEAEFSLGGQVEAQFRYIASVWRHSRAGRAASRAAHVKHGSTP